ncbi:MAG: hypothetical protein ABI345_10035 [Jatrophihabitans sp.]
MSGLRSGALAAWARAWSAGVVSLDDVIDAATAGDAPHLVSGLVGADLVTLQDLLVAWRASGATIRCSLPDAGDVRGLPAPAGFRAAALDAGEAVVAGALSVVPEVIDFSPSSAPPAVIWRVHATEQAPPDHQSVSDAQYDLTTAIRESASALAAADVGRWRDGLGGGLSGARRAGENINLPASYPPRAVALLAQSERLQAVLDLAMDDPLGGAVDRYGADARSAALRPLATAVRRARLAAYNATAD